MSEIHLRLAQRFFGLLALNGDTRQMGDLLDESVLLRSGAALFAIVDREGTQHSACRGDYRRGPARSQPVRQGQIAIIGPQRIRGDVRDDYWLGAVSGRPARTYGRADDDAVNCRSVGHWQA